MKFWKTKEFCLSGHNAQNVNYDPFIQGKKLRSLQGSYYETKRLAVSRERVQKKM